MLSGWSTRQKFTLAAALLLFALLKFAFIGWWLQHRAPQPQAAVAVCRLQDGCRLPNGARVRTLEAVAARTPFTVVVNQVPSGVSRVDMSFEMKGMDMGYNRYSLKPQPDGTWQAQVLRLPLCVENRRDYRMLLYFGGTDTAPQVVEFSTQ